MNIVNKIKNQTRKTTKIFKKKHLVMKSKHDNAHRVKCPKGQFSAKGTDLKKSLFHTKLSLSSPIMALFFYYLTLLMHQVCVVYWTEAWSFRPFSWVQETGSKMFFDPQNPALILHQSCLWPT